MCLTDQKTLDIWPQKSFTESLKIYDEWNHEQNSLLQTEAIYHNQVSQLVEVLNNKFHTTHPEQTIHFHYHDERHLFHYRLTIEFDKKNRKTIQFAIYDAKNQPTPLFTVNHRVNVHYEGITALIDLKHTFVELDGWTIIGFIDTFIRSTKTYLEMD